MFIITRRNVKFDLYGDGFLYIYKIITQLLIKNEIKIF
jgi:hypothetical protein